MRVGIEYPEVIQVPNTRNRQTKVRIVAQQGMSILPPISTEYPTVAALTAGIPRAIREGAAEKAQQVSGLMQLICGLGSSDGWPLWGRGCQAFELARFVLESFGNRGKDEPGEKGRREEQRNDAQKQ